MSLTKMNVMRAVASDPAPAKRTHGLRQPLTDRRKDDGEDSCPEDRAVERPEDPRERHGNGDDQQQEGSVFEGAQAVAHSCGSKKQLLPLRNCRRPGKASRRATG